APIRSLRRIVEKKKKKKLSHYNKEETRHSHCYTLDRFWVKWCVCGYVTRQMKGSLTTNRSVGYFLGLPNLMALVALDTGDEEGEEIGNHNFYKIYILSSITNESHLDKLLQFRRRVGLN